jgi:hypothetical protein
MAAGLLAWGLPAAALDNGGREIAWLVLIAAFPSIIFGLWLAFYDRGKWVVSLSGRMTVVLLPALLVGYIIMDAIFGRCMFSQNMFLNPGSVDLFLEEATNQGNSGRGLIDLFGTVLFFLPFALYDISTKCAKVVRYLIWGVVAFALFYQMGVSRGLVAMAFVSIVGARLLTTGRCVALGFGAVLLFFVASFVRGDFLSPTKYNPLFDGIYFPYFNLELLIEKAPEGQSWIRYIVEILQKPIPGSIYNKEVFSFNIEMTKVIYPFWGDNIKSISVFTYVAELLYYKPSWVVALCGGGTVAFVGGLANLYLRRCGLHSTRLICGFMIILLLRSRILDVVSLLVALMLFILFWEGIRIAFGIKCLRARKP